MSWRDRLARRRISGKPPSRNGASSFHLWWELETTHVLAAAAVEIEVVTPPVVPHLYFFALQVTFVDPSSGRKGGGAHIGLQHHPGHPHMRAVNWGGYAAAGGLLPGSESFLPSAREDLNTRDYLWEGKRPYLLAVEPTTAPAPEGMVAWAGLIEDVEAERRTEIRHLFVPEWATGLTTPLMWSEVFAPCDAPQVGVHWRRPQAWSLAGDAVGVRGVRLAYQDYENGGCTNTNTAVDATGYTQLTNEKRVNRVGAFLPAP